MSKHIPLSNAPTGAELEEMIAAHLHCAGYYVDKQMYYRETENILELDIVATDFSTDPENRHLIEVKSGDWGFPDIFKVLGWFHHLAKVGRRFDSAYFITTTLPDGHNLPFRQQKSSEIGVKLVCIEDISALRKCLIEAGLRTADNDIDIMIWRYSYWIERRFAGKISQSDRDLIGKECVKAIKSYHSLLADSLFFHSEARDRIQATYQAYTEHPRLSLSVARVFDGAPFDPNTDFCKSEAFGKALFQGKHDLVQRCLYLEHRARVSIIQHAIEFILQKRRGNKERTESKVPFVYANAPFPQTFYEGVNYLEGSTSFINYGKFWQEFLWGWGGFFLEEDIESEINELCKRAGIPVDEFERVIGCYDVFFPMNGSWICKVNQSSIKFVKMLPAAMKGVGAFRRRVSRGVEEGYAWIKASDYTRENLLSWEYSAGRLLANE